MTAINIRKQLYKKNYDNYFTGVEHEEAGDPGRGAPLHQLQRRGWGPQTEQLPILHRASLFSAVTMSVIAKL